MTLEQIVKQSQGEQYVYPDVFTDKCGLDILLSSLAVSKGQSFDMEDSTSLAT